MDALHRAGEALEQARIALRHTDLDEAERALVAHDEAVRDAVSAGNVAVSEMESLAAEQQALLTDLLAVRAGVEGQLVNVGRSAGVARAYLDTWTRE